MQHAECLRHSAHAYGGGVIREPHARRRCSPRATFLEPAITSVSLHMGDVEAVSTEFIAWCRNNNIQTTSIAVHQFDDGERGMIATEPIAEGASTSFFGCSLCSSWAAQSTQHSDWTVGLMSSAGTVLVRAPESVLLSVRSAIRDSSIQQALQSTCGQRAADRILLCVHLLLEASKRDESTWWPYLCSLPREYTILGAFPNILAADFQVRWSISFVPRTHRHNSSRHRCNTWQLHAILVPSACSHSTIDQ